MQIFEDLQSGARHRPRNKNAAELRELLRLAARNKHIAQY